MYAADRAKPVHDGADLAAAAAATADADAPEPPMLPEFAPPLLTISLISRCTLVILGVLVAVDVAVPEEAVVVFDADLLLLVWFLSVEKKVRVLVAVAAVVVVDVVVVVLVVLRVLVAS